MKLVAVQYEFNPDNYGSPREFLNSVEKPLTEAEGQLGSLEGAIVVYPEHIGTFLVFLDERIKGESIEDALRSIAIRRAYRFLPMLIKTRDARRALLSFKWKTIRKVYFQSFQKLASRYKSIVVAGSILEPSSISSIYNVSYVFGKDGKPVCRQVKVHLDTPERQLGISPGALENIHACQVENLSLGVAICLDAFKHPIVSKLVLEGAKLLIQPSANPEPWDGRLEEEWRKSSWSMVQSYKELEYGINPMAIGEFLDLDFEGISSIVAKATLTSDGTGYLARARSPKSAEVLAIEV